jgi:hypothetical protein
MLINGKVLYLLVGRGIFLKEFSLGENLAVGQFGKPLRGFGSSEYLRLGVGIQTGLLLENLAANEWVAKGV